MDLESRETVLDKPSQWRPEISAGKVLNWAGIIFLVLGAVFALMYSWQYIGVWFKVAGGLALAAGLVYGGEHLSRRDTNKWYGQGLLAGGWSLGYFIIYAMQNIQEIKVIDSVLLDCSLLVALAAGCMGHAMKKNSQIIAILSTALAFTTISLSTVTAFTVVASAVLAAGVTAVAVRMNWHGVLLASLLGSYTTYLAFTYPQIAASAGSSAFGLSAGFLILFWLSHNFGSYFIGEADDSRHVPTAVLVLNSTFFLALGLHTFGKAGLEAYRYLFVFITGATYLAAASALFRRAYGMGSAATLIGLSTVSLALPMKLNNTDCSTVWLVESSLLTWAGLRFNQKEFKWFAALMGILLVPTVLVIAFTNRSVVHIGTWETVWGAVVGWVAAASYAACGLSYTKYVGAGLTSRAYSLFAMMLSWLTTALHLAQPVPLLFSEAATFMAISIAMRDRLLAVISWGIVIVSGCVALCSHGSWTWQYITPIVCFGYAISALGGRIARNGGVQDTISVEEADVTHSLMGCATSAMLALASAYLLHGPWISVAWALEGLALLIVSFLYTAKWYERSGLALFALLGGRVLFIDFADAATLQRILSFLITGVAFLAGSYGFAWMQKNVKPSGEISS